MKLLAALVVAVCCMVALPSYGVVLVGWDAAGLVGVSGDTGNQPANWTSSTQGGTVTVDSGIQLTHGLDRGAGAGPGGLNNGWGATLMDSTTQALAISNNDYLYFSLAPQEGNTMSLSGLDYNIRLVTGPWTSGNARYLWQYKVGDGEFTNIGSALSLVGEYNTNGAAQPTLDLTGISALQNIAETVEFRLYSWNTGGQFVFGRLAGNDLAVNGTVSAIPEPSRALLLVVGGLVLGLRRSRSKSSTAA